MVCKNCGAMCRDDARFCNTCGTTFAPVMGAPMAAPMGYPVVAPKVPGKGLGITGMVLGIISLIICFGWVSIICGIVGVALSGAGLYKAKQVGMGNGMAVAGLVCSAIALAIWIILVIWAMTAGNELMEFYYYFS